MTSQAKNNIKYYSKQIISNTRNLLRELENAGIEDIKTPAYMRKGIVLDSEREKYENKNKQS